MKSAKSGKGGAAASATGADGAAQSGAGDAAALAKWGRGPWLVLGVGVVLGLVVRYVALQYAPQYSYPFDHQMVMSWSQAAYQHGPAALYFMPGNDQQRTPILFRTYTPDGRHVDQVGLMPMAYNYPPASTAIFWAQGALWTWLDSDVKARDLTQREALALRIPVQPVTGRVINTPASRAVAALPGIVADFLLAWGVAALVRALRRSGGLRPSPLLEAGAFAAVLLLPPVWLNSAFWNQADAWIAAPLVWCVVWLIGGAWWRAGAIFGLALMIKPQAILLGPVLVFWAAWMLLGPGGGWRRLAGIGKFAVAAAAMVGLVLLPFGLAKPPAEWQPFAPAEASGPPLWLERSYGELIFGARYARTTMNAFNIWWLDYMSEVREAEAAREQGPPLRFVDATLPQTWLGVTLTKQQWGKVLLLAAIVLTWTLAWRLRADGAYALSACAFVVFLAAFALPTGVHERYVYYCIPVALALACRRLLWLAPLIPLVVVGTQEMWAFRWVTLADMAARSRATSLAMLTMLALVMSVLLLLMRPKVRTGRQEGTAD